MNKIITLQKGVEELELELKKAKLKIELEKTKNTKIEETVIERRIVRDDNSVFVPYWGIPDSTCIFWEKPPATSTEETTLTFNPKK